ncbi:MAG TPA: NUDIX hydrolase [Myxococcota bacterium]|nr:NUDIX hydrolase [Myxococcota bacterium]HQK50807.1 NUDIX hydrolase [Myxococcota bacterium]
MREPPVRSWTRIREEPAADYRIFQVARTLFRKPDGRDFDFYVIRSPDWVNVVPVTPEGRVVLIRQWRAGTDRVVIEVPGGIVDPGEDPEAAAARELAEETGFRPGTLQSLGAIRPNPAIQDNRLHVFLARDCVRNGPPHLEDREDIEAFEVPLDQVEALIRSGDIDHALVLCALSMARQALAEDHR